MDQNTNSLLEEVVTQQKRILANQEAIAKRVEVLEKTLKISPTKQTAEIKTKEEILPPKEPVALENLEFRIGGTWLNRLGAVAVILGLSLFLKYSFDNQWIGPGGRVVLGILAGLALLGAGEKLKEKYFVYSQGLTGAGSLALYISVYAAYNFYHLISPSIAFLFLIIIMTNTVITSIRHDSLTIGILGIIGGYSAPILISTGSPLPWIFFGYLAILTCGILGVSVYKRWDIFRLLSFVINQALLVFWYLNFYQDSHFVPSFIFVVFNFIAYLVIATGYNIKVKSIVNQAEIFIIAANAFGFFAWSKLMLEDTILSGYLGFYALGVALLYICLGRLGYHLHCGDKKQVYTLYAVAISLITIAIYLQLEYQYVAYGWILQSLGIFFIAGKIKNRLLIMAGLFVVVLGTLSMPQWINEDYIAVSWLGEALGLFLMGTMINIKETRYSGLAALILGSLSALDSAFSWKLSMSEHFLLNWPTTSMLLAIGLATVIYLLYRNTTALDERYTRLGLGAGILVFAFALLTAENHHFFQLYQFSYFLSPEQLSLSLLWMIYAVLLFVVGIRKNIKGLRYGALALIGIIILKAFFIDLAALATVFKILLFIILGFFLLAVSYVYQRKQTLFNRSDAL